MNGDVSKFSVADAKSWYNTNRYNIIRQLKTNDLNSSPALNKLADFTPVWDSGIFVDTSILYANDSERDITKNQSLGTTCP